MSEPTLYMVGNAHLDPVWLWRWQEGFQAAKATFRSMLDRMQEYPDFVFTSSSAAIYAWIEENDPRMFAEIKERVAEGRWCIAGGWWLQPDCNLPSGESFARHALYGQHFFKSRFGVTATVGYNVDSFGHHAMLPQLLLKSGLRYYVFTRPGPHEKGLPGRVFWWESDDGSRVLAYRVPFEYLTRTPELEQYIRRLQVELRPPVDRLMLFYGVGNHGGGPTRENLDSIRRMHADPEFPALEFSSPNQFFCDVTHDGRSFPVVHDELQHHASGCYAVHSAVKRWNREAENLLVTAEKWSVLAEQLVGLRYPLELERAWKALLFNQFHDILAGTSIEEAYEDARDLHGEAMTIGSRALNHALQAIAWKIGIEQQEGMYPVVVFNPHAWAVTAPVEFELSQPPENFSLWDETGKEIMVQAERPSAVVLSTWRRRFSFVAELPPLGYRVYYLQPRSGDLATETPAPSDNTIENDRLRLSIDPATGYIASLFDKRHNYEVFIDAAAQPVVLEDRSDTWSHGVYQFQDEVGAFAADTIKLIEHGPVKSTLRVKSSYGSSTLIQDFSMYRALPQIEVRVTLDWHEQWKVLKLRFPVNLNFVRPTYEIPYGHIERPANGEEEPGQSWVDVSGVGRGIDKLYGLSLLNDGKYSFDVRERELSLTVLRSPIYAHHVPLEPEVGAEYRFIDQGVQHFSYTLLPHEGNWQQAGTTLRAAELNQCPISLVETYHAGNLPLNASYIEVSQPNIVVCAIKKAEENDDTIVRCYETDGEATDVTIQLRAWSRTIQTCFGPCEIKTFHVPADPALDVTETNLLEWEAA